MKSSTENFESSTKNSKPRNKIYLQVRDSTKCCNEALITNPKNVNTLYVMGKCLIQQENFGMAKEIIEKIKNLDPVNVYGNILEGHVLLKNGQLLESYSLFSSAYKNIIFHDVYLSYGLGLFYDTLEKHELARKWFTLCLTSDIELFKYLEIMYRIGVCYKKEKKLFDALGVFERLETFVKTDLFQDDVRLQIAHVYEIINEHDVCNDFLSKLKGSRQTNIFINRLKSWIYFKTNNFDLIKGLFECPKDKAQHKSYKFSVKNLQKELNYCDCSIVNDVKDHYILYLLGRSLVLEGEYDTALELFNICTQLDPKSYLAFNSAGIINYKRKNYETAKKSFQDALNIKPNFYDAINNLKVVNYKINNKFCATKILESDPDIFLTKYLDSQIIFNECICYPNNTETSSLPDLDPIKFENFC